MLIENVAAGSGQGAGPDAGHGSFSIH